MESKSKSTNARIAKFDSRTTGVRKGRGKVTPFSDPESHCSLGPHSLCSRVQGGTKNVTEVTLIVW
jgi:hypothetical protein